MSKFFPTIKFVDKMPDDVMYDYRRFHSRVGEPLGAYYTNLPRPTVYVKKMAGSWYILFHELLHWSADKFIKGRNADHKYHRWIDKHAAADPVEVVTLKYWRPKIYKLLYTLSAMAVAMLIVKLLF